MALDGRYHTFTPPMLNPPSPRRAGRRDTLATFRDDRRQWLAVGRRDFYTARRATEYRPGQQGLMELTATVTDLPRLSVTADNLLVKYPG